MAQPQQPLEIFLIRSYFKKTLPNLTSVPSSCRGLEITRPKHYSSTIPAGLSSLCYYSLVPGVAKGRDPLLHLLIRDPRDPDFPMRTVLISQFEGDHYVYTLSTQDIGLPETSHQLRCKNPWDFMELLLNNYKQKKFEDVPVADFDDHLAEHKHTFSITLEGDLNTYRDSLGTHYRYMIDTGSHFTCPRQVYQHQWFRSVESSDLDISQNLLRGQTADGSTVRRLHSVQRKIIELAKMQPESRRQSYFEWIYRGYLLRLTEFYYWAVMPIKDEVWHHSELAKLLQAIFEVSPPGLYPESLDYQQLSLDARLDTLIQKLPASESASSKIGQTAFEFTSGLERLPSYLEKVAPRLKTQMLQHRSEAVKNEISKIEGLARQQSMFWRFGFDLTGSKDILTEYIRGLLPMYKVVNYPSKKTVWGGKWEPLSVVNYGTFVVAVHSGFLCWAPADSSEEHLSDESKWENLADPLHFEGAHVVIQGCQNQTLITRGCIFLRTPLSIIQIDLNPLLRKQQPIYTDLFEGRKFGSVSKLYATSKYIAGFDGDSKQIIISRNSPGKAIFSAFKIGSMDPIKEKAEAAAEQDIKAYKAPRDWTLWVTHVYLEKGTNPHLLVLINSSSLLKTSTLVAYKVNQAPEESHTGLKYSSHIEIYHASDNLLFFLHRGLTIILSFNLSYYTNDGCLSVMRRGKLSKLAIPEPLTFGPYPLPDHYSRHEFVHFNPKTQTVVFHSSQGRYGEGYTISVHPLKLLLN